MDFYNIFTQRKIDFSNKKGIIFDLDGTLVDSMNLWMSDEILNLKSIEARERMQHYFATKITPKPYTDKLLSALQKEGIPFCIATNTRFWIAEPFITRYGWDKMYQFYIDCEQAGAKKDKPDIYHISAQRMGLKPEEIVVFEDLPQSAYTARKAGYSVVGIYDEESKNNIFEMQKICNDYIYNFSQILK